MSRAAAFQSQLPHEAKRPVTLPVFNIPDIIDTEQDIKETARRFLERRVVKEGLDAWSEINERVNSFQGWLKIGRALSIGKQRALAITMANGPWGQNYCREFSTWMTEHGFDGMPSPTRSVAIELAEHEAEISAWRDGLPEKQRRRLVHPLSVTRRWRAETQPSEVTPEIRSNPRAAEPPTDLKTVASVYLDALLRLSPPSRTEELMRIANLANVQLRHDLDRAEA